tara:strand:+ start:1284 stop:1568 length:285 start_codon:yes stop_codon:yes gene_type:complete
MNLDHDAIRKAYPDAVTIDDTHGAFKLDGTKIDLVQSVIDAARVELNKLNYQRDRAIAYPSIQEQLDMQYWDQINGTTTWKDSIAKVKSDNPKP